MPFLLKKMKKIVLKIRDILKQNNIQIKDLAEKFNITASAMSQQIANPNPTINWLNKIANIIGVEVTDLFEIVPDLDVPQKEDNTVYFNTHAQELIKQANLNLSQFADKMGIARQNVHKLFGTKNIFTLQKVSDVLGIPLTVLISGYTKTKVNGFIEINGQIYRIQTQEDLLKIIEKFQ